jgi:hypothetical protein
VVPPSSVLRSTRPFGDPPIAQHALAVGHEIEYRPLFDIPALAGNDCSTQDDPPMEVATIIGVPEADAPIAQQAVPAAQETESRWALARLGGYASEIQEAPPSVVEMMASDALVVPTAQQSVRETHEFENR